MSERPQSPLPDHPPGLAEGSGGLGAKRRSRRKSGRGTQPSLFCSCGQATPTVAGLTERYLGSRQNLKEAVNDRLGLDE